MNQALAIDWSEAPLDALVAHIVLEHHSFARRELPRIDALLATVVKRHGAGYPELLRIQELFAALGRELTAQMLAEEQTLFPQIERIESAARHSKPLQRGFLIAMNRAIDATRADHGDAEALIAQIRELAHGYGPPAGACLLQHALYRGLDEFERDWRRRVELEHRYLFPRTVAMEIPERLS